MPLAVISRGTWSENPPRPTITSGDAIPALGCVLKFNISSFSISTIRTQCREGTSDGAIVPFRTRNLFWIVRTKTVITRWTFCTFPHPYARLVLTYKIKKVSFFSNPKIKQARSSCARSRSLVSRDLHHAFYLPFFCKWHRYRNFVTTNKYLLACLYLFYNLLKRFREYGEETAEKERSGLFGVKIKQKKEKQIHAPQKTFFKNHVHQCSQNNGWIFTVIHW